MKKKMIIIVLIILILLSIILFCIGNFFYNLAVNSNKDKTFIKESQDLGSSDIEEGSIEFSDTTQKRTYEIRKKWAQNNYIEENIKSYDNLKLQGYYFENTGNDYIIVVHGYASEAFDMVNPIHQFYKEGYHVLAPDCRGHGKSEGDYIGMGWHDRKDIISWIEHILQKNENANIMLYGVSMGGATVMMTAGEDLPSNVKCIIEDCGYTNAKEEFSYQIGRMYNLPRFPIIDLASIVTKIRAGYFFSEASSITQLKKAKVPILFIHGDQDTFVPFDMVYDLYDATPSEKQLYIVENAGHGESAYIEGENYWNTIYEFMKQYK